MKRQDQKPLETLASQVPENLEERQDKSCATQSYRAPQVFLVGKANRLMANQTGGNSPEGGLWYYAH